MSAQVTASASTDVFVGQGSMMVTVLSAGRARERERGIQYSTARLLYLSITLTFGEVCAGIGLEELALLIAKVKNQNLLRNVHSVFALGLIAAEDA